MAYNYATFPEHLDYNVTSETVQVEVYLGFFDWIGVVIGSLLLPVLVPLSIVCGLGGLPGVAVMSFLLKPLELFPATLVPLEWVFQQLK